MLVLNYFFPGYFTLWSCRYNIRYGRVDAGDEEVEEAAKAADIHEKIQTFTERMFSDTQFIRFIVFALACSSLARTLPQP